ncbi:hypothetical protein [uncultured Draconibacterium sp.]|uniref:hypothetical protein n=1 Tax=uncultured Draconibacterium sp. TaxID=1573823 RepID=UPI002AA7B9A7|nr:hypothetical protein [uncultured Draconibacterium sp.]
MKTSIIIFLVMCCSFFCAAQLETQELFANMNEVEVSPPIFTGARNTAILENSGTNYFKDYLIKSLNSIKGKLSDDGTEVVSFVVTSTGQVADIEVINSVSTAIDREFIAIIEGTSGMWRPALKDGRYAAMPQEVSVAISYTDNAEVVKEFFQRKAEKFFSKAGNVLFEKRDLKRAENLYDRAILYMPNDCSNLIMRGLCRFERGNKDGAIDDWSRVKVLGDVDIQELFFAEDIKVMDGYKELITLLGE